MKARPILLILLILIIGFVLGMLTSAQIRFHHLMPFRIYSSEDRFREGFYNIIQPDKKQKSEINRILRKYARLNSELQAGMHKTLDSNMKEMRKELDSKLTVDQLARLKQMEERRQQMIRQFRRNRIDSAGRWEMRPMGPADYPYHEGMPMPPPERQPIPPDDSDMVRR